jgi:RHS repeat-associated protein
MGISANNFVLLELIKDGSIMYTRKLQATEATTFDYTAPATGEYTWRMRSSSIGTTTTQPITYSLDNLSIFYSYPYTVENCDNLADGYRFGFNGKEKESDIYGESNAYDFGARFHDTRLGRFLSVDPLAKKYTDLTPYSFAANTPIQCIDRDGEEPARNQSGTIQAAINQWKSAKLVTASDIRNFVSQKGNIRYVYTESKGWIDLQHYFGVQTYGKGPMDMLEPASGNKILQDYVFGPGADKSYYSYEDLPSNQFSAESKELTKEVESISPNGKYKSKSTVLKTGEELFNAVEKNFKDAKSTSPENAPNWKQIPFDDQDRERIPENATKEQMNSGNFVPQNHSSTPINLKNFKAAPTSIEKKQETKKGKK